MTIRSNSIGVWGIAILSLTACGGNEYAFTRQPLPKLEQREPEVCKPVIGEVAPQENKNLRWKWETSSNPTYNQLMSPVMIADINLDGVSDFVFVPYAGSAYTALKSVLRVVSGVDGTEIWSSNLTAPYTPLATAHVTIYDVNRDGKPEIFVPSSRASDSAYGVSVYSNTGAHLSFIPVHMGSSLISLMDLKNDGKVYLRAGSYLMPFDPDTMTAGAVIVSPLLDVMELVASSPGQEIVKQDGVYSADNKLLYKFPAALPGASAALPGYANLAYGDFNGDGKTDVVINRPSPLTITVVSGPTGERLSEWVEPTDLQAECTAIRKGSPRSVSGALNIGDADGDGIPDITMAGSCRFFALKGATDSLTLLWSSLTRDHSSSVTGSSIYDLNGDGRVEVLYNDELYFRIYDGKTGEVLFQIVNDSGTLLEYPTVASLRPGEPASIVLAANNYTNYMAAATPAYEELLDPDSATPTKVNITGVRVIQSVDKSWMPTRTIWNQYQYQITNVLDNLQIPETILDFVGLSNRTRANIPNISHPCVYK